MSGSIDFTMGFNTRTAAAKATGESGYRIYMLGNFSGRPCREGEDRKIRKIDVDSFDQVMAEFMPSLEVGSGSILQFGTLEDFHPDAWLKKVPILADLLALKNELNNPVTAAKAAAKIRAFLPSEAQSEFLAQEQEEEESQEAMLERLLGRRPERPSRGADAADSLVSRLIKPYVTKSVEPEHRALINVIESTIIQVVLAQLHRPEFQTLESLWRASASLVNEEYADRQSFFLVDIRQSELLTESRKGLGTFEQKLRQHIQAGGHEQDTLLIGNFDFSDSPDDKELLQFCSRLAEACGAVFLSVASHALIEHLVGGSETDQRKESGMEKVYGGRVVLAYPRYLQRLPYGKKRNPVETLAIEECSAVPKPEELSWGNSAFLCARSLIRSRQGLPADEACFFSDVPTFAFDSDGEQVLQAGTEVVLNEAQANALISNGITPLVGFRQRQGVRLMAIVTLSAGMS